MLISPLLTIKVDFLKKKFRGSSKTEKNSRNKIKKLKRKYKPKTGWKVTVLMLKMQSMMKSSKVQSVKIKSKLF
jgi:hypothetical protein